MVDAERRIERLDSRQCETVRKLTAANLGTPVALAVDATSPEPAGIAAHDANPEGLRKSFVAEC